MWYVLPIDLGWIPESLIRAWIRHLNRRRLRLETRGTPVERQERFRQLLEGLRRGPVTVAVDEANRQHYEVPCEFFERVLGPNLKYSGCWWGPAEHSLGEAEEAMLDLYVQRADIRDGQHVLDLGCGWGSLTLHLARRFPNLRITALSNSRTQREFILGRLKGDPRVEVITADVGTLPFPAGAFDRIVSVEMLEHVRNHQAVFRALHHALKPGGKLFVHVFCHREATYLFDGDDWMETYFFAGGIMPGKELLVHQCAPLVAEQLWLVDGTHYQKTAEAWLEKMRADRPALMPILARTYGQGQARKFWVLWQLFFLACAELFGHAGGQEWMVAHYLFSKPSTGLVPAEG